MGCPPAALAQAKQVSLGAAGGAHKKLGTLQMTVNEPVPKQPNTPGGKGGWHNPPLSPNKLEYPQDTHVVQLLPA